MKADILFSQKAGVMASLQNGKPQSIDSSSVLCGILSDKKHSVVAQRFSGYFTEAVKKILYRQ